MIFAGISERLPHLFQGVSIAMTPGGAPGSLGLWWSDFQTAARPYELLELGITHRLQRGTEGEFCPEQWAWRVKLVKWSIVWHLMWHLPSGNDCTVCYWSHGHSFIVDFSNNTMCFSIAMWNYQRVPKKMKKSCSCIHWWNDPLKSQEEDIYQKLEAKTLKLGSKTEFHWWTGGFQVTLC